MSLCGGMQILNLPESNNGRIANNARSIRDLRAVFILQSAGHLLTAAQQDFAIPSWWLERARLFAEERGGQTGFGPDPAF
jgi:hypothetical protein